MFSETSVNLCERGKKPKLQLNKRHIVSDTARRQLTEGYIHTNPPVLLPKKPKTKTENTTAYSQNKSIKKNQNKTEKQKKPNQSKNIKVQYSLNRNLLC